MARARSSVVAVGPATREMIAAAMPGLTLTEAKVALGIVSFLTTWSKTSDTIANRQLREVTGMDERRVSRGLRSLAARGVIGFVPGGSDAEHGRRAPTIALTPGLLGHGSGAVDPRSDRPPVSQTPGQIDPRSKSDTDPRSKSDTDPRSLRPPSEDVSEEQPTEEARASVVELKTTRAEQPPADAGPSPVAAILSAWWEVQTPRPQQKYIGTLRVLERAYGDGWTIPELERALPELGVISGGSLDLWRKKRAGSSPTASRDSAATAAGVSDRLTRLHRLTGGTQ